MIKNSFVTKSRMTVFALSFVILLGIPVSTSYVNAQEASSTDSTTSVSTDASSTPIDTTVSTSSDSSSQPVAVLSTDRADYHPGELVTILGNFFSPVQDFILKVLGYGPDGISDYTESTQNVSSDNNGSFSGAYSLDNIYRPFYDVVASDLSGNTLAQTYFRDSAIGTYDQCSNDLGAGYSTGDTGCRWINGNLNANNSTYFEGDSTVQRAWIEGYAPGSTHTLTFHYGTTKGGHHAYDYLTTWDASENWITVADRCQGIAGCATAGETTFAIPHDPNGSGQFETGTRNMTMRGGTITNVTPPAIVSGTYAGDSDTSVDVTFTVPSSGDMCSTSHSVTSCDIAIWFGAHVAKSSDWSVFNGTTGAGSISGSPYHVQLAAEDGASVGNRDNQMQSNTLPSQITIHKITVPAQDPTVFSFTGTGNGYSNFTLTGGNSNSQTVIPKNNNNTYTITEGAVSPWNLTGLSCTSNNASSSVSWVLGSRQASTTLDLNSSTFIDCTFTNTKVVQGHIIVDKVTSPSGDSQSFAFTTTGTGYTGFNLTDTATPNDQTLNAGTYSVAETPVSGWVQTSATCDGGNTPASINLAAGQTVHCTFNNTKLPKLTVTKVVVNNHGGTKVIADFPLFIDSFSTVSGVASTTGVGAHTVSETQQTGYTKTSITGDCTSNGSITLAAGDVKSCTITNTDVGPTLKLVKTVTNDNGGKNVSHDWTLTATGNGGFSDAGDSTTFHTVNAGVGYVLSESAISGYSAGNWSCDGGTLNGSTITLGLNQNVTCTINNNDQTAHLKLVKTVTNDNGGTAVATDFTLSAAGPTPISGAGGADSDVNAGSYNLSETNLAGYAPGSWSCVGGTQNGASVSLVLGESATCTINNNDIAPTLTLVKTVANNHGGNAVTTDFQGKIDGGNVPWASAQTVNAGAHTASETNLSGYTAGTWGGDCATNGSVTLAPGDAKTCTITNSDQPAHIILIKHVTEDNGGTAGINDFGLTVGGSAVNSGDTTDVNSNTPIALNEAGLAGYNFVNITGDAKCPEVLGGSVTLNEGETVTCTINNDDIPAHLIVIKHIINNNGGGKVAGDFTTTISGVTTAYATAAGVEDPGVDNTLTTVGSYSVDEGAHAGYDRTLSSDCSGTIALGQTKTCTITNDDVAPILTVIKHVINDNGGTAVASNFTMNITGTNVAGASSAGIENPGTDHTLDAGSYSVDESAFNGYTKTIGTDCSGTIAIGEHKTCTITNDDQAPHLTLNKIVVNDNGGTAHESDWTLTATGLTTLSGQGAAGNTDVVSGAGFSAGTYTLSESTGPSGYTPSDWSCTGDVQNTGTSITLGLGQSATCTITNDDQVGHLKVHKITDPASDTTTQFPITLSSAPQTGDANQNIVGGGTVDYTVNAGTYSVSENVPAGWDQTSNTCDGIAVANGETKECTITNTEKGHLIVDKVTNPSGDTQSFAFTTTGTGYSGFNLTDAADPNNQEVKPGTYSVSEGALTNWTQTSATCDNNQTVGNIQVAPGQTITCTFTNTKKANLTIVKNADPNDLQDFSFTRSFGGAFSLDDDANVSGADNTLSNSQTFSNLSANNDYTVTEAAEPNQFWKFGGISCVTTGGSTTYPSTINGQAVTVNLTPGADVTCTFLNIKTSPTRTLGFWQTHTAYTTSIFNSVPLSGSMLIGNGGTHKGPVETPAKIFGGFYAPMSKTTTGAKRSAIDQARINLLQQLIAAKLNCAAFGCAANVQTMITTADTAYASGTAAQILASASALDAFNNSGDTLIIGNAGSATPTTSKSIADLAFWNTP